MALSGFLKKLFPTAATEAENLLTYRGVPGGLELLLPPADFNQARQGFGNALAQHQYLRMQMLLEEDLAAELRHGIRLGCAEAAALDEDSRFLFNLPARWPGKFVLQTRGLTTQADFSLGLALDQDGERIPHYTLAGPLLRLSENEIFLPDPAQWRALAAVAAHQAAPSREEYQNLHAVHEVLNAAREGLAMDTGAFKRLETQVPERITLAVEVQGDGSLELMPGFGGGLDQNDIQSRLGQLRPEQGAQSLRIGNTVVLLNEKSLAAAHNILSKHHIPASQRRKFLNAPGSYLDAALVDLDAGFSLRAKGVGPFQHAYFGETDNNEIDWFIPAGNALPDQDLFDQLTAESEDLVAPQDLPEVIKDPAQLADLRSKMEDALTTNADVVRLDDLRIDVRDRQRVYEAMDQTAQLLANPPPLETDPGPLAVDIHLNDQQTDFGNEFGSPERAIQYTGDLDFDDYTRQPFPHQIEGVRWMLALATNQGQPLGAEHRILGGLLADDMGLGKTYMSIVGIRETLRALNSQKPVLVVAPLSLLENWKREVQATYSDEFFNRIVILQADGDLPQFRMAGRSVETKARMPEPEVAPPADGEAPPWETDSAPAEAPPVNPVHEGELEKDLLDDVNPGGEALEDGLTTLDFISLKIGPEWGPDRLDLPGTMVLTTYQTLRDYQFSLVSIPWSVVVFDEAQNIKSPNTLQTRAAKALDAEFKLLVTGTPVENHLGEFWCLLDTVQPGFLGSYQGFREEYIKPILKAPAEEAESVREEIGQQLRDRVGGFMLRRIKEDHLTGLPEKRIILGDYDPDGRFVFDDRVSRCMDGEQLHRYDGIIGDTVAGMEAQEQGGVVLSGLQRLRSATLHPALVDQSPRPPLTKEDAEKLFAGSGKLAILKQILDEIRARDEKVLVFAVNKRVQELVAMAARRLYDIPVNIINGSTKAVSNNPNNPTRQGIIDQFQAEPGFGVLLISPVAAGVGLTIVGANNVIHLERHWNPAKEAQATDRAYRIGQTKDVNVYIPILTHPSMDSFDVNLNRLLSNKMSLKDAIITQEEVHAEDLARGGVFGHSAQPPEN